MRKISFLLALAVLAFASCQKEAKIVADFDHLLYNVYSYSPVEIVLNIDKEPAAGEVLEIPVTFGGNALINEDYTVSAEKFTFSSGVTSSTIVLTDNGMTDGQQVIVSIVDGTNYKAGTKFTAVVAFDAGEKLIYNFTATSASLIESVDAEITITGEHSGTAFKAAEDLNVPIKINGDDADKISLSSESIVVPKGSNKGKVTITPVADKLNELANDPRITIEVDRAQDNRFLAGDKSTFTVKVSSGLQVPARLAGTWTFGGFYDYEDLEFFIDGDGYDISLFPLNNTGFTLTITEDEETGEVTIKPGSTGDFGWFFREGKITMTAPKNVNSDGEVKGSYTAEELPMFMMYDYEEPLIWTYYELEKANRLFDAKKEKIEKAVVAMSLDGDTLNFIFKDYDLTPFLDQAEASPWYDGEEFDSDLIGFVCYFTKEK